MEESFNFLLFSPILGVKDDMSILFPQSFWLLICGSTQQNKYSFTSKSEKHLETRLHNIRALNPRPEKNLHIYKKVAKKEKVFKFKVSELVTSFSISSPGSLVFTIALMLMRVLSYQLTGNF